MDNKNKIEVRLLDFGAVFIDGNYVNMFSYKDKSSINDYMTKRHGASYNAFMLNTSKFNDVFDEKTIKLMNNFADEFVNVKKVDDVSFILETVEMMRESQQALL